MTITVSQRERTGNWQVLIDGIRVYEGRVGGADDMAMECRMKPSRARALHDAYCGRAESRQP